MSFYLSTDFDQPRLSSRPNVPAPKKGLHWISRWRTSAAVK